MCVREGDDRKDKGVEELMGWRYMWAEALHPSTPAYIIGPTTRHAI